MHAIQLLDRIVDKIRRNTRRLRIEHCVVALRMQQHLVQTPEHAVCLQQLHALCFDALLEWSSRCLRKDGSIVRENASPVNINSIDVSR
jgi:hypothetical protein